MPCNMSNPWTLQNPGFNLLSAQDVSAQCEKTCIDPGNTSFFYSNYPEKLLSQHLENGALWCEGRQFAAGQTVVTYRCYLWHINEANQPLYAGLTLENHGTSNIQATNGSGVMFSDQSDPLPAGFPAPFHYRANLRLGGTCIAQSMLARTLDPVPSLFRIVQPGARQSLLQWGPLSNGRSYGVYVEFQVSGQPGGSFTLREVYATSEAGLTNVSACQIPKAQLSGAGGDGRGNWPTNMIRIQAPVLEINGPQVRHRIHCAASIDQMPDNCWPASGEATGNRGKYGVVYTDQGSYPTIIMPYRIQPNSPEGTVQAWLTGGAAGGGQYQDFFGSAYSMSAGGRVLPSINVNRDEAVLLFSQYYPANGPLVNNAALVSVAVAGAATTPFDVVLRWV